VFSFAEGPVDIFSMLPNQGRKRGHWPWRPKRLNDPGAGSNVARLVLISIFQVDVFFFCVPCSLFQFAVQPEMKNHVYSISFMPKLLFF
jgi:hypothetical protein